MAKQKLTAADEKAIVRFGLDQYDRNSTDRSFEGRNPFGGTVPLNEFEAHLYNVVMNLYQDYLNGKTGKTVQDYDRMKYIMLKLNPSAYMALID